MLKCIQPHREELSSSSSLQNLSKGAFGYEKEIRMQSQSEMGPVMQECMLQWLVMQRG